MKLPKLTLTWPNDVRIYYDPNNDTWSSDYDEPVVSKAYITIMKIMTDVAFLNRGGYTPYPFFERIEELATKLRFTLDGMPKLKAALIAESTRMLKEGAVF